MAVSRINEAGLNVNQYGNRNLIINGAMQVDQRGSYTITTTGSPEYGGPDRFHMWSYTSTEQVVGDVTQSTDVPSGNGFGYSRKFDVTTAESGAKSDIGRRASEISQGAFGGSRARLQQSEADTALNRGLMEAVGGIRSRGYQQAQQAAMGEFGRQRDAMARAAQGIGSYGRQGQQLRQSAFEDAMRRRQQAASGMGGLSTDAFGQALSAYQMGTGAQRAGAAGIGGLGRQGFDMLTSQIGTLGGLGAVGRGIQDRGFESQYRSATQLADEPWMRMQRGMSLLGGIAPYGASIRQGYGTQQGSKGFYQDPSSFMKGVGTLGELLALFRD